MSEKYLIAPKEYKCIGCQLCVLMSSVKEQKKLGYKDSPISIKGKPGKYKIQIDYGSKIFNKEKIVSICPQNCFEIIEKN